MTDNQREDFSAALFDTAAGLADAATDALLKRASENGGTMTREERIAARKYKRENKANAARIDRMLGLMRTQGLYSDTDDVADIEDMLADIRHWCDRHNTDFAELDGMAHCHYTAEVAQARTGQGQ
jgi:hypothetical protein